MQLLFGSITWCHWLFAQAIIFYLYFLFDKQKTVFALGCCPLPLERGYFEKFVEIWSFWRFWISISSTGIFSPNQKVYHADISLKQTYMCKFHNVWISSQRETARMCRSFCSIFLVYFRWRLSDEGISDECDFLLNRYFDYANVKYRCCE